MDKCDRCRHQDGCVCVPYGCENFDFDLSKHDAKIRADAIDECIDTLYEVTPQTVDEKLDMVFVNALEQLKEQKNE